MTKLTTDGLFSFGFFCDKTALDRFLYLGYREGRVRFFPKLWKLYGETLIIEVGQKILVNGNVNADGSITAQSIQISKPIPPQ